MSDGRPPGGGDFAATGVSIDTRTLEPGDLFVALAGVRDGHEFVGQRAWPRARPGALVSQARRGPGGPRRRHPSRPWKSWATRPGFARRARRGAVTGSVGKTSVTQAIRAGLALAGRGPRLGEVLQQPHRRAADPGAHAARHRARDLRDRHEPRRRDRAAVAHGPPARRGDHHRRPGAHRELPRRRGRRGPRQGRDLRGPRARRRGGAQRRQRLVRPAEGRPAAGRGQGAHLRRGPEAATPGCSASAPAPGGARVRGQPRRQGGRLPDPARPAPTGAP